MLTLNGNVLRSVLFPRGLWRQWESLVWFLKAHSGGGIEGVLAFNPQFVILSENSHISWIINLNSLDFHNYPVVDDYGFLNSRLGLIAGANCLRA